MMSDRSRRFRFLFTLFTATSSVLLISVLSEVDQTIDSSPFTYIFKSLGSHRFLANRKISHLDDEEPIGGGGGTTFLLAIFSCLNEKEAERRNWVRDTYLNKNLAQGKGKGKADDRICSLPEYQEQVEISKLDGTPRRCKIPYIFVVGAAPERPTEHFDDSPLTIDHSSIPDAEDDVIYLNIRENMENGKSSSYFKYGASLSAEYGIDYIAKTDSDSIIGLESLFTLVEQELPSSPYNRRIYGGVAWSAGEKQFIYAAGQFYFMSSDLAHYVGYTLSHEERMALTQTRRPTEDLDMGSFIYSHPRPIKFVHLSTYLFWAHPKKTKELFYDRWEDKDKLMRRGNLLPFAHLCKSFGYKK